MANSECLKKHSSELKKAQKKANTLEVDLKKAKETLAAAERARDANDCWELYAHISKYLIII